MNHQTATFKEQSVTITVETKLNDMKQANTSVQARNQFDRIQMQIKVKMSNVVQTFFQIWSTFAPLQLRERKKKLAVEDTEMVAYVDASRRCVTDTMGQKVWLWWRLWCWFHSFQPTFSFLRIFEEIYWSTGHEWRMKLWRKETIWWGSKPPPHFLETHFKMASWEPYCPVFCSVITE